MCGKKGMRVRNFKREHPVARQRIWQSMRIMRTFSKPDLVGPSDATYANVEQYVTALHRAEYLLIVRRAIEGKRDAHAIYRLIRDSGPHAPRLQRNGDTWDPNLHQVFTGGKRHSQGGEQ